MKLSQIITGCVSPRSCCEASNGNGDNAATREKIINDVASNAKRSRIEQMIANAEAEGYSQDYINKLKAKLEAPVEKAGAEKVKPNYSTANQTAESNTNSGTVAASAPPAPEDPKITPNCNFSPRHKAEFNQAPPPKVKKAEEAPVTIDAGIVEIVSDPSKNKVVPDIAKQYCTEEQNIIKTQPQQSVFDNSAAFTMFKYAADIEKVAIENGYQVSLIPVENVANGFLKGIINGHVFKDGVEINEKEFVIDLGFTYDRREKVFLTKLVPGFEYTQAFPITISNGNNKKSFNRELFQKFIVGGREMISDKEGMYTQEFRELNSYVALITMPTKDMNRDTRTKVRERLIKAMKSGIFSEAISRTKGPACRFVFESFDKQTGTFVLTNNGVPLCYGSEPIRCKLVKLEFADGVTNLKA